MMTGYKLSFDDPIMSPTSNLEANMLGVSLIESDEEVNRYSTDEEDGYDEGDFANAYFGEGEFTINGPIKSASKGFRTGSNSEVSDSSSDESTISRIIPCTVCHTNFSSKNERYAHENNVHNYDRKVFIGVRNGKALKKKKLEETRSKVNKDNSSTDEESSYECDNCHKEFDNKIDFNKHKCKRRMKNLPAINQIKVTEI